MTLRMIGIHSLPKAAIPKYHKVGGFKQHDSKAPCCFYSGDGSISRLTPLLIQLLGCVSCMDTQDSTPRSTQRFASFSIRPSLSSYNFGAMFESSFFNEPCKPCSPSCPRVKTAEQSLSQPMGTHLVYQKLTCILSPGDQGVVLFQKPSSACPNCS